MSRASQIQWLREQWEQLKDALHDRREEEATKLNKRIIKRLEKMRRQAKKEERKWRR